MPHVPKWSQNWYGFAHRSHKVAFEPSSSVVGSCVMGMGPRHSANCHSKGAFEGETFVRVMERRIMVAKRNNDLGLKAVSSKGG